MYVSSYVNKHGERRIQVTLSLGEASLIASGEAAQLRERLLDLPEMTSPPKGQPVEARGGDLEETLDAIAPMFTSGESPIGAEEDGDPPDGDRGTS
jgi:hypothetical protein